MKFSFSFSLDLFRTTIDDLNELWCRKFLSLWLIFQVFFSSLPNPRLFQSPVPSILDLIIAICTYYQLQVSATFWGVAKYPSNIQDGELWKNSNRRKTVSYCWSDLHLWCWLVSWRRLSLSSCRTTNFNKFLFCQNMESPYFQVSTRQRNQQALRIWGRSNSPYFCSAAPPTNSKQIRRKYQQ